MLIEIDRFLRRTNMAPTTFGRRAVNDPRIVHDMRRGRQIGSSMRDRIAAFIAGSGR